MNYLREGVRQHDTHRNLVSRPEHRKPHSGLKLDTIIVPASRPATNLDHAITLARALHCRLLILCSHRAVPAEVEQLLAARSFDDAIVIGLPRGYSHELLRFTALASIKGVLPKECGTFVTDLSTKRNVGLILARMLGWQHVFFLDDDIRDINHPDLRRTVSMLGSFPTVGMRVIDYPDNSVVCHANRETGAAQDVFVTGAALAVDCQADIGFFPDVYNEDWLFFFDAAARGQLAGSGLKATQLRYQPFADPQRAAWQEFGDTLAEGIYTLLHLGRDVQDATSDYWADFLGARQKFLEEIIDRSHLARLDVREQIVLSVKSALGCLAGIAPELCERYIRLWRQDLRAWQQRVAGIPRVTSLDAALRALRLPALDDRATWRMQHRPAQVTRNGPAGPVPIPQFPTFREFSERDDTRRGNAATTGENPGAKPIPALPAGYHLG